jgi:hypothetical protein
MMYKFLVSGETSCQTQMIYFTVVCSEYTVQWCDLNCQYFNLNLTCAIHFGLYPYATIPGSTGERSA